MDIYSPEILTAQQNLIFLLNYSSDDSALINSSKQKLQLLGLTGEQLKHIETAKQPINPLPVYTPIMDTFTTSAAAKALLLFHPLVME